MGRGIIRELIVWDDYDQGYINANDFFAVSIDPNELINLYAATIENIWIKLNYYTREKVRDDFRDKIDKLIVDHRMKKEGI